MPVKHRLAVVRAENSSSLSLSSSFVSMISYCSTAEHGARLAPRVEKLKVRGNSGLAGNRQHRCQNERTPRPRGRGKALRLGSSQAARGQTENPSTVTARPANGGDDSCTTVL